MQLQKVHFSLFMLSSVSYCYNSNDFYVRWKSKKTRTIKFHTIHSLFLENEIANNKPKQNISHFTIQISA